MVCVRVAPGFVIRVFKKFIFTIRKRKFLFTNHMPLLSLTARGEIDDDFI